MYPTLNLGPFVFPTAGIAYLLGIWLSLSLIEHAAKRLDLNVEGLYGLAVTGLLVGFVAARLLFVLEYWAAFQENLLGIIWPLTSGYNVAGGLFFGVAGAFFYGRYKQLPFWSTLDALTPGLLGALITISLADFLAGPGYGKLTTMPWGISVFGIRRHPVQLYEIALGLVALVFWWQLTNPRTRNPQRSFPGQAFLLTAVLYSTGRLFIESFRDNAWLTAGGFHIVQIIALLILLGSLILLARFSERQQAQPTAPNP
ncbi:MAG: prolipoprotein diacylglyceryl transferase [Ardenticatenaceae bacterium]|nr:prolipoprotein diacylglyceryl transferase [Ardenticatenaceae bacterium]